MRGRIVYQDLTRINKAVESGSLAQNEMLQEAFGKAQNSRLHLIGLVSDGGVHSHQDHLIALANIAKKAGVDDIMVHAITDGRDCSPTGGEGYIGHCEDELAKVGARIATVIGRYYAMDRDKRWDRTKLGWDAIFHGKGEKCEVLPSEAIHAQYQNDKTDEFLLPMIFEAHEEDRVRDGDVVLFFNFRADRARQLSQAILYRDFNGFARGGHPEVHYVTLTEYDENYDCPVVFPPEELDDVLGKVVADAGKTQLRIAETEKYPHVSFFFNGGIEEPFEGEDRELLQSPKDVATYDEKPEMSALAVTDALVANMENYDLVILNFANPDMVGHTGVIPAAIQAVECIDRVRHGAWSNGRSSLAASCSSPRITATATRCSIRTARRTRLTPPTWCTSFTWPQDADQYQTRGRHSRRHCADSPGDDGRGKTGGDDRQFTAEKEGVILHSDRLRKTAVEFICFHPRNPVV